jgi:hypothetical protein
MSESLERSVAIVAAAMALSAGVTVGVAAEKTLPVDLKIGADAVSKYVWRGQLLTDDPVFQPTATVSYKGLSLNLWGSLDMTDIHETSGHIWRLQELDYTLAYAYSPLDGLDLQAGATAYTFPGTTFASTTEVYASAALSKVLLAPTLTVYRDIDEADSWYANAGVSHTFAFTEKLGLTLGAGLGWGDSHYHDYYFGDRRNSLSDLLLSSSLNYAVNQNLSLSLYLKYSDMVCAGMRQAARGTYGDADAVFGGVNATLAF